MTNLNAKYYIIKFNDSYELDSGDLLDLNEIFDSYSTIEDAENKIKENCEIYGFKRENYTILEVDVNVKELVQ